MKLKFILRMLIPTMSYAIELLREKDANSTGLDDIAADQLSAALETLQEYTVTPEPLPT